MTVYYHRIKKADAVILIADLLAIAELKSIATNYSIGGAFNKSSVYPKDAPLIYYGFTFFICNNIYKKNSAFPENLFCAVQPSEYVSEENPPVKIEAVDSYIPNTQNIFNYTESQFDQASVSNFLDRQMNVISNDIEIIANRSGELESLSKNEFLNNFPKISTKNPYTKSEAAFFVKNFKDATGSEVANVNIEKFLTQSGLVSVRYYFGYRSGDYYKDYRFTIILMGVDANGNNLMDDKKNYILEKSWPPGL